MLYYFEKSAEYYSIIVEDEWGNFLYLFAGPKAECRRFCKQRNISLAGEIIITANSEEYFLGVSL